MSLENLFSKVKTYLIMHYLNLYQLCWFLNINVKITDPVTWKYIIAKKINSLVGKHLGLYSSVFYSMYVECTIIKIFNSWNRADIPNLVTSGGELTLSSCFRAKITLCHVKLPEHLIGVF